MYERFTDRAREVMQIALGESQRLQHDYIGSEHILLGLAKEGVGVAATVFKNLGVNPQQIILEVERSTGSGSAKKVIEHAMEESRSLGHAHVGTEHILLGMLRGDVGIAGSVLLSLGLRLEMVRAEIQAVLRRAEEEGDPAFSPRSRLPWASDPRPLADDTKRRVRELADAIVPLQKAMEDAIACQDFERAASVRNQRGRYWMELRDLRVPEWVWRNVERLTHAWVSRFPVCDTVLYDEVGEPDGRVLSLLPSPLIPSVNMVVGFIPRFPVSSVKALLAPDDISSPYFQPLVPLISPESVARARKDQHLMVRAAFNEVGRLAKTSRCPALVCIVRPTALSEDVQMQLYAGIRSSRCDFVVFEEDSSAQPMLERLPPSTTLVRT